MKIGFVGLGKLGLPIAQAISEKHELIGFDLYPRKGIRTGTLDEVCQQDIIFVAVQTPHDPKYEGVTKLPAERVDFDYSYLEIALADINEYAKKDAIVVVISTCLPGNIRRITQDLSLRLVYNPFFIAMGTEVEDFLGPEFILAGSDDTEALDTLEVFYMTLTKAPFVPMGIEEAELTKVAYNTFISTKLAFVNVLLEICHKMRLDVDQVTNALCLAHRRLISPKYMRAGMGDGGGCHPRDNIAMSWLSRKLDLGFDLFEAVMMARQKQAEWLADEMKRSSLPKAILGYSFKKESDITTGSHALLVRQFLDDCLLLKRGDPLPKEPHCFLIGMNHEEFASYDFPEGSLVIDPWRYIPGALQLGGN